MSYTVDIDTGGTFTDGFFTNGERYETVKVDTTPHDLTVCFSECIAAGAGRFGLSPGGLLRQATVVRLSTTIGTNSLIQRTGPRLGVLVTAGRETDLYHTGGGSPLCDFLVSPALVRGVAQPVREPEVRQKTKELLNAGAQAIVVALADSFRDPDGERRIREAIVADYPKHYLGSPQVFLASDLCKREDPAQRINTVVLNAYLHPEVGRYLYKADDYTRDAGLTRPLLIDHVTGGAARVAKTRAIDTYNSGPVAGLMGVSQVARLYGLAGVVGIDVGGTSTDISLVRSGSLALDREPRIDGLRVEVPLLAVATIGVAGGSAIHMEAGRLVVGPQSAGARPGPACYGLGGTEPTVTDACVALGCIDPDYFLGGSKRLDKAAAVRALQPVAAALGIPVVEAAWLAKCEAEVQIARPIRDQLAASGMTAAGVSLFSFGGAGGLLAAAVAKAVAIPETYTFPFSSVFSAYGSSTMDIKHLYEALVRPGDDEQAAWAQLVRRAAQDMRAEGFTPEQVGQERSEEPLGEGHRLLRLTALAAVDHYRVPEELAGEADPARAHKGMRAVYWGRGWESTPVYDRALLRPGHRVPGPAVVEAGDTTYIVHAGQVYAVDRLGSGVIRG